MKKEPIEFYEVQRFRQWWVWAILIAINLLFVVACVQQLLLGKQFGDNPMSNVGLIIFTVFVLIFSLLMLNSTLHTYINDEGVYVKFFPFRLRYKLYDWNNIQTAYVRKYSPIREFGGWGIKHSLIAGKVYSMSGNKGLQLVLMNGRKVLIGTKQPEHLTHILTKLGKMKN